MSLPKAWTKLNYHPEQTRLWTTDKLYAAVPAGRGSGKTELAKRRLVRYLAVKKPWGEPRYFYGAPTVEQAARIAWNDLLALIPKEWLAGEPNVSKLKITTVFGSYLQVVGLDKPQRIEGVQWDGCVIDESCDIKPGTFDRSVMPALMHRNAWCWRIGVPKRFGIGALEFRQYYEKACRGEIPEADGFWWPSEDIVPKKALELARATLDPRDFAEQFGAQFLTASGGIFHAFDSDYNVRPCSYNPNMPIVVGSDFNVNPMAWVLCHCYGQIPNHRMEVFDMLWLRDSNTPHALSVLKQRYGHHTGGFQFYGDATGQNRATASVTTDYLLIKQDDFFKQAGRTIHYPKHQPARADRFAATNALIRSADGRRRCFIDPHCRPLIDDLTLRSYRTKQDGQTTREPADSKDIGHASDALGYIIHRLYPIRIPQEGRREISVTGAW